MVYTNYYFCVYICLCACIYKENDISSGKMLTMGGSFVLFLQLFYKSEIISS